jgi:DNA invertase Pin-like site-specific DNA recombinase
MRNTKMGSALTKPARAKGKFLGRPKTIACRAGKAKELFKKGYSKSKIAKELKIARSSVRRLLAIDE